MKRGFMAIRVVGSRIRSKRRFTTARVVLRAVAIYKVNSNLLNAKIQDGSRIRAKRRFMTARVV